MWPYLKAAFWVGVDLPGLGRVPVNAMVAAAFGILGFAEPALWLLGVGVEASVLFALTTSDRFRKVVDVQKLDTSEQDVEARRRSLITTLPPDSQRRLLDLAKNCTRVSEVTKQSDDFLVETNREALHQLEWVYLKLLVARNNLTSVVAGESPKQLLAKMNEVEASLQSMESSESLRQSRTATLAILRERWANIQRRKETLDEIDSDLTRIESQVQLLLENASMQGKPTTISSDIELASNLASSGLFGDSGGTIAALDRTFGRRAQE